EFRRVLFRSKNVPRNNSALCSESLCLSEIPVVYEELVAVINQALREPTSHVTQANESDLHLICRKTSHRISTSAALVARALPLAERECRLASPHWVV